MTNKKIIIRKTLKSFLAATVSVFILSSIPASVITKADGGPALIIETAEIDINDIPEDRWVKLTVSIENNTGTNAFTYNIKADSRLYADMLNLTKAEINEINGVGNCIYDSDQNIINANATFKKSVGWYSGNGPVMSLNFILPEDYRSGDYYPVEFIENSEYEAPYFSVPGGVFYYYDLSGSLTSGGIKITGTRENESPSSPDPEPQKDPEPQHNPDPPQEPEKVPETEAPSNDESNHTQPQADVTSVVTSDSSSSADVSVTSVSTVTTVPKTTVSATVSSYSYTETTVTSPAAEGTTTVTVSSSEINEKSRSLSPVLPAAVISAAAVSGALYIIAGKRRKKDRK